jgi:hypothetical protein
MKRLSSLLTITFSFLFTLGFIIGLETKSYGQAEPKVLSLQPKELGNGLLLPLLIDPSRIREIPQNEAALKALSEALEADKKALANEERKGFYAKRIASGLALQAAFWLRHSQAGDASVIDARDKALSRLISFAPTALRFVKDPDQRQEILLSLGLSQYLKSPSTAVKTLAKVKPRNASERDLTAYLIALQRLRQGDSGGLNHLEASAARLGKRASLTTALAKASYLSARKENYRSELLFASRLCHELSAFEQDGVFLQALFTWTKSSDFKGQWEPVPFNVNCFQKTPSFPAFMEELAIFAKSQGHLDKAIAYYQQAAAGTRVERASAELTMRFVETHRKAYLRDGRRDAYQSALIDSERVFHALPQGIKMLQMHDELILHEIALAWKAGPGAAQLGLARVIYNRYMEAASFSPGARRIRGLWVDLLVRNHESDEAIDTLLSLSRGSIGIVRQQYVERALELQNKILAWSENDPWQLKASLEVSQMARLGQIVDLLLPAKRDQSSIQILRAQIAQRLGLSQEAGTRFQKALLAAVRPSDQNQIFTRLLLYAVGNGDGMEIERLAEESFAKGFQLSEALPDNKTIKQLYIDTLVSLAEGLYTRSQWPASRSKIDKVAPLLADRAVMNRLLYLKARSFQNESLYNDALATLDLLDSSPLHDEVWQNAVLDRSALLLGQANLEGATASYARYLSIAAKGERSVEVRAGLADLLIAQGRWSEARTQLLTLILGSGAEEEDLNLWGQKLVEVHKNLRSEEDLRRDVKDLAKLNLENKAILAQLLHLNLKENRRLEVESYFVEQDLQVSAVQDLMAEAAYLRAKDLALKSFGDLNLKLRSPSPPKESEVRSLYDALAKAFVKACDRQQTPYCAMALGDLVREIDKYRDLVLSLQSEQRESSELVAYLAAEKLALEKQVFDAAGTRSGGSQWLDEQSKEAETLWRYIGINLQKGLGALDLPSLISKDASLNYSHGAAQ